MVCTQFAFEVLLIVTLLINSRCIFIFISVTIQMNTVHRMACEYSKNKEYSLLEMSYGDQKIRYKQPSGD